MKTRLQKWGSSLGIRIPNSIVKSLDLKINDLLELEQIEDKVVISISKNKKISLKERFNHYKGENLAKNFTWDDPQEKEIW